VTDLLVKNTARARNAAIAIIPVATEAIEEVLSGYGPQAAAWAAANEFTARAGSRLLVPGSDGKLAAVLYGTGDADNTAWRDPFSPASLASELPAGTYRFDPEPSEARELALGWLLHAYRFTRYKKQPAVAARLVAPAGVDAEDLRRIADGVFLARDLVNTPADDMGPDELEAAVRKLARAHKAKVSVTKGDDLLKKNYPLIHAVGRASDRAPRLIDMTWGPARAPKVTLVGKGVCFDTGGLNLKPGGSMALMKKDMGGAANVLGLAAMIMSAGLKVRLRVLIPAVDNNVSANAFRPSDVFPSRDGMTVEIGNTDAEGRLVLADALTLADTEQPDLLVDMATLTGAARVALGPDLPPFYTDNDDLAGRISAQGAAVNDPLWRMPFWPRYDSWLDSKIADVNHISDGGFAGSLTAALFLKRFVRKTAAYVHFDIYAWTPAARPGRPHGGEAQGIRALYAMLSDTYGR
jgi:leucyl aminopeptidase